jgi:hypothetical protein
LLENHDGAGTWRYRRDAQVTLPIERFGRTSSEGIPYIAPEIALLYKAKGHEIGKNAADFVSAEPSLDDDARAWLRDALSLVDPDHPWLRLL